LRLSGPPAVIPSASMASDEVVAQFLPRIEQPVAEYWDRIDAWIATMKGPLRRAIESVFRDDTFRVEFERAPGATRGHHARIGGLLQHTCEVAEIARASVRTMGGDESLVTAGALLHDIGKVRAYAVDLRGFENTPAGHLLGHIVLGSLMLEARLNTLPAGTLTESQRLELHHFIQSHHGILEFGAAVRPMTLEAELLHYADQASAKGNDFNEAQDDTELFPTDDLAFSARRSWRLERRVWKRSHTWE
jgi:3'-5' exoribonuclease